MSRASARVVLSLLAVVMAVIGLAACGAAASPSPAPIGPSPSPRPRAVATPTPSPTPAPTPTPTPAPTPPPLDQALLDSRLTVLIAGLDMFPDRRRRGLEVNTDAMVVVSIAPGQERVAMVALPRDATDLPLANGRTWTGKANAIYRNLGIEGLRGALEATYGIDIDYHAVVDMADFGRVLKAVGGVDVKVPAAIRDSHLGWSLGAGWQHLNHNDALRYVRSRYGAGGDYGRAARQMQVLAALLGKIADPGTKVDLPALLASLKSLETDVPLGKLPTLVEIARRAAGAEVSTQVLGPPRFALFEGIDGARGWVMIPNLAEIRAYVRSVMGGG
jgi:polyisoprenyl-teichoic acid--peptidoglycan teichoic acid transferase